MDKMREAFEKRYFFLDLNRSDFSAIEIYKSAGTEIFWEVWKSAYQAALSQPIERSGDVVEIDPKLFGTDKDYTIRKLRERLCLSEESVHEISVAELLDVIHKIPHDDYGRIDTREIAQAIAALCEGGKAIRVATLQPATTTENV